MFRVVVIVFSVSVVIGNVKCSREVEEYVVRPFRADYEPPAMDWIRSQVAKQRVKGPEEVRHFLAEILDRLNQKQELPAPYSGNINILKDFLSNLVLLANDERMTAFAMACYIKLVEHVFGHLTAITKQPTDDTDQDAALFNYLQHYGRIKFAKRTEKSMDTCNDVVGQLGEVETVLDELVASQSACGSMTIKDDKHLAESASKLNLLDGAFNANFMMRAASRYLNRDRLKKWGGANALSDLVFLRCYRYMNKLENELLAINVNRLLNPDMQINDRMVKLLEYGRLCHQIKGRDEEVVMRSHMEKQLKASKVTIFSLFCPGYSKQVVK